MFFFSYPCKASLPIRQRGVFVSLANLFLCLSYFPRYHFTSYPLIPGPRAGPNQPALIPFSTYILSTRRLSLAHLYPYSPRHAHFSIPDSFSYPLPIGILSDSTTFYICACFFFWKSLFFSFPACSNMLVLHRVWTPSLCLIRIATV